MTGQALVTIGSKQWTVYLATTPQEWATGLAGLDSLAPGTGMLFDFGADIEPTFTSTGMLFPLDIVWVTSGLGVLGVSENVPPGTAQVNPPGPVRFALEVNAGEAAGIQPGTPAYIQQLVSSLQEQMGSIVSAFGQLVFLGFAFGALGMVTRGMLRSTGGEKLLPQTKAKIPETRYLVWEHPRPTRDDVSVNSWVERDRIGIWVTDNRTDKTLIEWWDEDAAQMFEDGFFKPGIIREQKIRGREFENSVLDYAEHIGVLEPGAGARSLSYLPQTIERGEVIEIPFKDAPAWVQEEWRRLHAGSIPRVRVYRTTVARVHPPVFEYAVRDIVAHKAGETMAKYVPAYESLLAVTPEERELYFGGAVKLGPDEAMAVMDYWGDRFKSIDLYVHPAAYEPPKLVAPTLTERQMKILATIRGYTSAYRKEVFQAHGVTQKELDELQRLGLIDRRGAITVMGRNVVGREQPLTSYLPQELSTSVVVMPRFPPEAKGDFLFMEYIRDMVKLGERLSDEDVRQLWEVWQKPDARFRPAVQHLKKAETKPSPQPRLLGPTERKEPPKELEFFADSPDHIEESMNRNGLRTKLDKAFQEAIRKAKGGGGEY